MSWILDHIEAPSVNNATVDSEYAQNMSWELGHNIFPINQITLEKDIYTAEDLHIDYQLSSLYISERGQYLCVPITGEIADGYDIYIRNQDTGRPISSSFNKYYLGALPVEDPCILLYIEYKEDTYAVPCLINIIIEPQWMGEK